MEFVTNHLTVGAILEAYIYFSRISGGASENCATWHDGKMNPSCSEPQHEPFMNTACRLHADYMQASLSILQLTSWHPMPSSSRAAMDMHRPSLPPSAWKIHGSWSLLHKFTHFTIEPHIAQHPNKNISSFMCITNAPKNADPAPTCVLIGVELPISPRADPTLAWQSTRQIQIRSSRTDCLSSEKHVCLDLKKVSLVSFIRIHSCNMVLSFTGPTFKAKDKPGRRNRGVVPRMKREANWRSSSQRSWWCVLQMYWVHFARCCVRS